MELAIKNIFNDQTLRNNTVEVLKDFNSQSLATQAEKGKQLASPMPAIKKTFDLMGDDVFELSTENETLKNQLGDYDQKWLAESRTKLMKEIDDGKKANLIMSRMQNQMKQL